MSTRKQHRKPRSNDEDEGANTVQPFHLSDSATKSDDSSRPIRDSGLTPSSSNLRLRRKGPPPVKDNHKPNRAKKSPGKWKKKNLRDSDDTPDEDSQDKDRTGEGKHSSDTSDGNINESTPLRAESRDHEPPKQTRSSLKNQTVQLDDNGSSSLLNPKRDAIHERLRTRRLQRTQIKGQSRKRDGSQKKKLRRQQAISSQHEEEVDEELEALRLVMESIKVHKDVSPKKKLQMPLLRPTSSNPPGVSGQNPSITIPPSSGVPNLAATVPTPIPPDGVSQTTSNAQPQVSTLKSHMTEGIKTYQDDSQTIHEKLSKLVGFITRAPVPPDTDTPGTSKRYLSQEGLYEGGKPFVSPWNMRLMEHRLKASSLIQTEMGSISPSVQHRKWVDSDGQIVQQLNPLKQVIERPSLPLQPIFIPHKFVPATSGVKFVSTVATEHYQLDIDIVGIQFHDHPLFNEEDLLSSQLELLYTTYEARRSLHLEEFFSQKIEALSLHAQEATEHQKYFQIKKQLHALHRMRIEELETDRQLVNKILVVWSNLRKVRKAHNYSSTQVRLFIKKVPHDLAQDEAALEKSIIAEVEEMEELHREENERKVAQYEKLHALWLKKQNENESSESEPETDSEDSPKNSHNERDHSSSDNSPDQKTHGKSATSESSEDENDTKAQLQPKLDKEPEPPAIELFDFDRKYEAVRQQLLQRIRKPGDPELVPSVLFNNKVTSSDACAPEEKTRRENILTCSFFIKVFVNNRFVSTTAVSHVSYCSGTLPNFFLHIGEIFPLQLARWPDSVILQIYTLNHGKEEQIGEIYANIPIIESAAAPAKYQFRDSTPWTASWDIQNSNSPSPTSLAQHFTCGTLSACLQWARNSTDNTAHAPPVPPGILRQHMASANSEVSNSESSTIARKLKAWIGNMTDPNDPRNRNIQQLLSGGASESSALETPPDLMLSGASLTAASQSSAPKIKRAEENLDPVALIREKRKIMYDKLIGHQEGVLGFRDVIKLPQMDFTLPNIFALLCSPYRPLKPTPMELPPTTNVPPTVNIIAQILHAKHVPARRNAATVPVHPPRALVPPVPARPMTLFPGTIRSPFGISTPMPSPTPVTGSQQPSDPATTLQLEDDDYDSSTDPFENVCPFVQLSFSGKSTRTNSRCGSRPQWNETLTMPVELEAQSSSNSTFLNTFDEPITISVYDDVTLDIGDHDDREKNVVHQRTHARFLGSTTIPWSSLLVTKVDGAVRLESPINMLGYTYSYLINTSKQTAVDPTNSQLVGAEGGSTMIGRAVGTGTGVSVGGNKTQQTFGPPISMQLWLHLSLDPPIALPEHEPLRMNANSSEIALLKTHSESWLKGLHTNPSCVRRFMEPYGLSLEGSYTILTRLITPQVPPPTCSEEPLFTRFVSLIPLKNAPPGAQRRPSVTMSSQQFLLLKEGDWLEHAVLLCNFLTHKAEKEAWVLVGTAQGEGKVAYVLTKVKNPTKGGLGNYTIINPVTGRSYLLRSPPDHLSLQDISIVFNASNIWANIQPQCPLTKLKMNFDKHWKPFFTSFFPLPKLSSFQVNVEYPPSSSRVSSRLQRDLEQAVVDAIQEWRRHRFTTRWSRAVNKTLSDLLETCEDSLITFIRSQDPCSLTDALNSSYPATIQAQVASAAAAAPDATQAFPEKRHITALSKWIDQNPNIDGYTLNLGCAVLSGEENTTKDLLLLEESIDTAVDRLCNKVFATGAHLREERDVDFSVAVKVVPYPCDIFSVWLYFVVLQK
ncbi:protein CC2D2B [Pelomyxa schiedti]|nr:protein CC2D2B [Pelomyxa schiedti]